MFIVNQSENQIEKIKQIYYKIDYDDETKMKLEKIYDNMICKSYNYGSTEDCLKQIKKTQDDYINRNDCKKIFHLYVNENKFASYKDISEGKEIFRQIITAIANNENLFDLSYKEGEL